MNKNVLKVWAMPNRDRYFVKFKDGLWDCWHCSMGLKKFVYIALCRYNIYRGVNPYILMTRDQKIIDEIKDGRHTETLIMERVK